MFNGPFEPFTPEERGEQTYSRKFEKDRGEAIVPVPKDVSLDMPIHSLGAPIKVWDYRDSNGGLILRVCRFVDKNGDKQDRPLTYRRFKNGQKKWHWVSVDAPRPLYGLDRLAQRSDAPVIVCEGEKATDAATKLFPDYVAVTSPNGAGSPHKADWGPLAGRRVVIWPDHDAEGENYAKNAALYILKAKAVAVAIVTIPDHFPDKWDLADEPPEGFDAVSFREMIAEAEPIRDPLDGLVERSTIDPGEPLKPNILAALRALKQQDRAGFETLRSQLKKAGVRVTELDRALREQADEAGEIDDPDHLDLARDVIERIGADNILGTSSHVWQWNECGVWKNIQDRALKQEVQRGLEHIGEKVTRGTVDAVTDVLKSEIHAPDHEWNINQEAINVLNGELEWSGHNWELNPHTREHYRTTQIPLGYDPAATCPRFEQFLGEVFRDDSDGHEKAQALSEMMGYTLVNHTRFEKFALLVGSGANGKSVVMEVLRALVGSQNVTAVQPSQFDNKFQRAHLHLKLANLVTEIAEGGEIADAELKAIVSGELTTAEHKNKDPFDFTPFCTCWFGTNHMPHTRDFSDALFRRALVIPFNRTFKAGVDADPDLKDKLKQELPGILNLALKAFGQVLKRGKFTEPKSCLAAKEEWRLEADQVAQFVQERCVLDPSEEITSAAIYDEYKAFADENGISRRLNRKNFTNRLVRLGCKTRKGAMGKRMIDGIRIGWNRREEEA